MVRSLTLVLALAGGLLLADAAEAQGRGLGNARTGPGSQRLGSGQQRRNVRSNRSAGRANRRPDMSAMMALRGLIDRGPKALAPGPSPEVGGPGRRPSAFDLAEDSQLQDWFRVVDHNVNGWLGYRETEISLRFDRPRFRVFDPDNDGRITYEEFTDYYLYQVGNTGGFRPPEPASGFRGPAARSPEQLRIVFDGDGDRALDENELRLLLEGYDRFDLRPEAVLEDLDRDRDLKLSIDEMQSLPNLVFQVTLDPSVLPGGSRARSVDELFGTPIEIGSVRAPRLPGPVTHFRRLDQDDDGRITAEDLSRLLRPGTTPIRPATVLNTLDANGDGHLDRSELRRAFSDPLPAPAPEQPQPNED